MDMTVCVATRATPGQFPDRTVNSFLHLARTGHCLRVAENHEANRSVVQSYQWLWENSPTEILAYLHDDSECREQDWDVRVLKQFEDPKVGLVGFGGALWHGASELYRVPYEIRQLGRSYYLSNVDDAEVHGRRFTGESDVAVLDGFSLIVRKKVLDRAGGWPVDRLQFHCYDYWLCAMAHRLGYTIRVVGVRCHHHGGRTSTTDTYQEWCKAQGKSDVQIHEDAHVWIAHEFKDVLPWRCV